MADLTVTAANVVPAANAVIQYVVADETVVAGKSAYFNSATGRYGLFDANAAGKTVLAGVFLGGAGAGQPVAIQTGGDLNPGAAVTQGLVYVGSATPGGIAPSADLVSGWVTNILGVATSTSNIRINIQASGATV